MWAPAHYKNTRMGNTKKIRMLTSVAGTDYAYRADQVVDAPADIADDLLRGGHAVPADGSPAHRAETPESKTAKRIEKR